MLNFTVNSVDSLLAVIWLWKVLKWGEGVSHPHTTFCKQINKFVIIVLFFLIFVTKEPEA